MNKATFNEAFPYSVELNYAPAGANRFRWSEENFGLIGDRWNLIGNKYYFNNEADAMFFALKWKGR